MIIEVRKGSLFARWLCRLIYHDWEEVRDASILIAEFKCEFCDARGRRKEP